MPDEESGDAWARRVSSAIAGGSRAALGELYERRFDFLYRTVRQRTRCDEHFALDCVQDAMVKLATSLGPHGSVGTLDAWLRRVVLSAALDRLRRERSRVRREDERAGDVLREQNEVDLERLRAEVDALASAERSLLDLRFRRGLTLAQTGEASGLAPKAVDSRVRRTLARLRSLLGGDTPLPPAAPPSERRSP